MTAAYRLKGIGWFGGVVVVTLGFYLVSLQVAAERKRLEQVDAKIVSTEREIRALETEFDTRANLTQLERWNGDTLSLVAPTAAQFIRGEAQFASIRFDGSTPQADLRTASLVVPAYTAQALTTPLVTPAVQPVIAAAAPVVVAPAQTAAGEVPRTDLVRTMASVARAPTAASHKAQAVAMLDRTLLSDSTLGDLVSGARSEAGRLR